jgi:tRNA dimethylallyltransferase
MVAPLVVIVGPTASGKSALAMQVAKKYNGEIICADSRTVYKGMDIGTAKPSLEDQDEVRHHVLDVVEPDQSFSAAEFKRRADNATNDIISRGKLPILVGGTGLYIDAVLYDYQFGAPANEDYRAYLNTLNTEELQEMCSKNNIDIPINSYNKRHLVRAIELEGLIDHKKVIRDNTIVVGIATDRETLQTRIEQRTHVMVEQGIMEEVRRMGELYGWGSEAMTGNIYRIFEDVVGGDKSVDIALKEVVQSDMNLAKRQMTWFKRNKNIIWNDSPSELMCKIGAFIDGNKK